MCYFLFLRRERTLDARGLLARQRRGASERVVLVTPNEKKKTSGTQGRESEDVFKSASNESMMAFLRLLKA